MPRVGLAVGDVGIRGLEAEHQIGLVRALGRLKRLARSKVGQRCARDLCVIGRGESVGRVGEGQMERCRGCTRNYRGSRRSIENNRTRRSSLQGPEIELLGEAALRQIESNGVFIGWDRSHETVRAGGLGRTVHSICDLTIDHVERDRHLFVANHEVGDHLRRPVELSGVGRGLRYRESELDKSMPGASDVGRGIEDIGHRTDGLRPGNSGDRCRVIRATETAVTRHRAMRLEILASGLDNTARSKDLDVACGRPMCRRYDAADENQGSDKKEVPWRRAH